MYEKILILGIGGFIGSNLRYFISKWCLDIFGTSLPYGTLVVNIVGSFILGFITLYGTEIADLDPNVRLFIGTGMMGALTTFSTFSLETVNMMRESNYTLALTNTGLNLALSMGAIILGFMAARALG